MRTSVIVSLATFILSASPVFAFDLQLPYQPPRKTTIHPQVFDVIPNDGILDAGSLANPYILESPQGRFKITPQVPDLFPNDGILDGGSLANPWTVTPDDE